MSALSPTDQARITAWAAEQADTPSLLHTLLAAGLLDRVRWHREPIEVDR